LRALLGGVAGKRLFGHEGAFTGADRARGAALNHRGGTLFLVKSAICRGSCRPSCDCCRKGVTAGQRSTSMRISAHRATHRDLGAHIRAGTFREDLYYRLKVISIKIPPLREREGDILPLAEWLLGKHAAESARAPPLLAEDVKQALRRYAWPGNVRELSNVMERCVLFAGDTVGLCDLPEELMGSAMATEAAAVTQTEELFDLPYSEAVAAARRLIVLRALEQAGGHQTKAADRLGVTQPYLSRLAKQLGIRRDEP
jgi:DNA-binding NtrC family response regulator